MTATSISGLSSGIDWGGLIDQLREAEYERVDLLEQSKTTYQDKLNAWQDINSLLLSFMNAAEDLNETSDFSLFTTSMASNSSIDAEDVLAATAGTNAAPGTYSVVVQSLATAEKLSSRGYASQTEELNLTGDMIVGGRVVSVGTTDTLISLRDKINVVNTGTNASGVSASIVNYGDDGYRLILSSESQGIAGISLLNAGAEDLLGTLGFVDAADKTAKNIITGGNESDAFKSSNQAVGDSELLGLTNAQTGTVNITINGVSRDVTIDLSTQSLEGIRDNINAAFSDAGFSSDPASVISEIEDTSTQYRLLIEGASITYTDSNNVLETLGVLERAGVSAETGLSGSVSNTASGIAITASTRFDEIDGYLDISTTDTITLTGVATDGTDLTASPVTFSIYDGGAGQYKTVGDLLSEIEAAFGQVTASSTPDGRIQVADNEIGDTDLQITLTPSASGLNLGTFGDISNSEDFWTRVRQIQAGSDAEITVDGVTVTSESNRVEDVINGVTLDLKQAAPGTTVSLTVGRDSEALEEKIGEFVAAYNEVMGAINKQFSYNQETEETGGPLFGDSTLRTIRSNLTKIITNKVPGTSDNFSTLGLIGITLDNDRSLSIDDATLSGYLETNFEDVRNLFVANWTSSNSHMSYVSHGIDTQAGTYNIHIDGTDPIQGYFVQPGDASGQGEFLTGESGNAEGLLIRYTGTDTGDIGSLTLNFGIAELLYRELHQITDSTDGYVASKEESLQSGIERIDKNIQRTEDRIEQRMAVLTTQFIAMEQAINQMQNLSSWMSQQLAALQR